MKSELPGLYIHIPFCLSKCGYCSFYSVASPHLIPEYVKSVVAEMKFYKDAFQPFDTIYFGGGTPSLLSLEQIQNILDAAHSSFKIDGQSEITMEVNPGDVSLEYFQGLKQLGVSRLNIGVQSFDDRILKSLGRRHTAQQAMAALEAALQAGFENIGIDLIYGVYGQDHHIWMQSLDQALRFSPEHLSCYQLSLDPHTELYNQYRQKGWVLPSENDALYFFISTSQRLTDAGYIHYEVSNYARSESLKSHHNTKYWRHQPYLGLGPAAHSFQDRKRWWNKADVIAYLSDLEQHKSPVAQSEELSLEQMALEALFLGLRTQGGIDLDQYKSRFDIDLLEDKKTTVDELLKNKLVEVKSRRLCPTLSGMALADSLALI